MLFVINTIYIRNCKYYYLRFTNIIYVYSSHARLFIYLRFYIQNLNIIWEIVYLTRGTNKKHVAICNIFIHIIIKTWYTIMDLV